MDVTKSRMKKSNQLHEKEEFQIPVIEIPEENEENVSEGDNSPVKLSSLVLYGRSGGLMQVPTMFEIREREQHKYR